jgi:hypothetical protein
MSGFSACFLEGLSGICDGMNGFYGEIRLSGAIDDVMLMIFRNNKGLWGMDLSLINTEKQVNIPFELFLKRYASEIPENGVYDLRKEDSSGHPAIWIMDKNTDSYEIKNVENHVFAGFGACYYKKIPPRKTIDICEIKNVIEDIVNYAYEEAGENAPDGKMLIYPENLLKKYEGRLPVEAFFSQEPDDIMNIILPWAESKEKGTYFAPKKVTFKSE